MLYSWPVFYWVILISDRKNICWIRLESFRRSPFFFLPPQTLTAPVSKLCSKVGSETPKHPGKQQQLSLKVLALFFRSFIKFVSSQNKSSFGAPEKELWNIWFKSTANALVFISLFVRNDPLDFLPCTVSVSLQRCHCYSFQVLQRQCGWFWCDIHRMFWCFL